MKGFMPPLPSCAEPDVRKLRDLVYGVPSTDMNWEYTKHNWMRFDSIKWLVEQSKKPMSKFLK